MRGQTGLRKICTLVISGSAQKVNDLVWLSSKNCTATSIHIIYDIRKVSLEKQLRRGSAKRDKNLKSNWQTGT